MSKTDSITSLGDEVNRYPEKDSPEWVEKRGQVYDKLYEYFGKKDGYTVPPIAYTYNHENLWRALTNHLEIVESYLPFIENRGHAEKGKEYGVDNLIELINKYPDTALNLRPVFDLYPNLIQSYEQRLGVTPDRVVDCFVVPSPDGILNTTRIIKTSEPQLILDIIERNKQSYNTLVKKMEGRDWAEAAIIPEVAKIAIQRLNRGCDPLDAVMIYVTPVEEPVMDFATYTFAITKHGLTKGSNNSNDSEFGFLFIQNMLLNEHNLVRLLEEKDFGSEELVNELSRYKHEEGTVGVMEYIQKQNM